MKLRIQSKSAASQRRRRARLRNNGICIDCAREPAARSGRCEQCYARKLEIGARSLVKRRAERRAERMADAQRKGT